MNSTTDTITEMGVNTEGRLYIKPLRETFPLIYRTASGIHWDAATKALYSQPPAEWSYLDWYAHIIKTVYSECGCRLQLAADTLFVNVPDALKLEIVAYPTP